MDKNMSALLDENACTIRVRYQHDDDQDGSKAYMYVYPNKDIKPGDVVVVPTTNRQPKTWVEPALPSVYPNRATIGIVVAVDEDVQIEPNSDIKYFWAICKLDLTAHAALMQRNKEIENVLQEAYKQNMRRSFASQALAGLPDEVQLQISQSLGKKADEV
jgi:hypothetical protein